MIVGRVEFSGGLYSLSGAHTPLGVGKFLSPTSLECLLLILWLCYVIK
jgi:hypothetical protein